MKVTARQDIGCPAEKESVRNLLAQGHGNEKEKERLTAATVIDAAVVQEPKDQARNRKDHRTGTRYERNDENERMKNENKDTVHKPK